MDEFRDLPSIIRCSRTCKLNQKQVIKNKNKNKKLLVWWKFLGWRRPNLDGTKPSLDGIETWKFMMKTQQTERKPSLKKFRTNANLESRTKEIKQQSRRSSFASSILQTVETNLMKIEKHVISKWKFETEVENKISVS